MSNKSRRMCNFGSPIKHAAEAAAAFDSSGFKPTSAGEERRLRREKITEIVVTRFLGTSKGGKIN